MKISRGNESKYQKSTMDFYVFQVASFLLSHLKGNYYLHSNSIKKNGHSYF